MFVCAAVGRRRKTRYRGEMKGISTSCQILSVIYLLLWHLFASILVNKIQIILKAEADFFHLLLCGCGFSFSSEMNISELPCVKIKNLFFVFVNEMSISVVMHFCEINI